MVSKETYINVLMLASPHVILDYKVSHTIASVLMQGSNLAKFSTCIFSQVEFLATC